jgi:hypothetical protein
LGIQDALDWHPAAQNDEFQDSTPTIEDSTQMIEDSTPTTTPGCVILILFFLFKTARQVYVKP